MNKRLSQLLVMATACLMTAGCTSLRKDHVRVSSKAVFSRDDERVWQLNIETRKSAKFRLVGRQCELWGETAKVEAARGKRYQATVWLVGSQIIYGDHAYAKVLVQGCGSTVTATQEFVKDNKLNGVVDLAMPDTPVIHPLDQWLVIGQMGSQNLRLMVGSAVYDRNAEPGGAANGSQPIRSETNRTSSAAGSRR